MNNIHRLYGHSLALLTDLYQLTMAYGYWRRGDAVGDATFHLFFREAPFRGGYAVCAGLQTVLEILEKFRFTPDDCRYLSEITGNDGRPLFEPAFLEALGQLRLDCDIDAIPEGTVVFPNEPLLRVTGPLLQCQILETLLLNIMNFQTLIATKSARICGVAGDGVLEFGLRRAQGIDGGLSAARAAYIGGCAATSNVLAGKLYGIPVRGTHAHSWVMSFDDELEAFVNYAEALPNNCVFLVDTYDTLQGVHKAAEVGKQLRQRGHEMVGIRLDSGDLAYLSIEARRILDQHGFPDAVIVASNDLDETTIESLLYQGAKINVWGVGTKLATAFDQPALGGVYKLSALRTGGGDWQPKIKLSEQRIKTTIPGRQQVRRFHNDERLVADMIYDEQLGVSEPPTVIDPNDPLRRMTPSTDCHHEDLLVPVVRGGGIVYETPGLETVRRRALEQVARLHASTRRLLNPHPYPVGLERQLNTMRDTMIAKHRHGSSSASPADE
ncbi:nicotinate phosphoribosyltransferase [Roseimaritima sediminicola]|uniref:nicotinate phosphoribosyltransferase n=1 Tax=Roseimaritima sediminicola TaxID=2662066 RepID=UPI00129832C3|nr:nicotinate phosphoribosyltransferase [Roseimaritima sediminicola]